MDYAFTLSGRSSELTSVIYPPIELQESYEIAMLNLEAFNSIPNITPDNNKFPYYVEKERHEVILPTGTYELDDIHKYIEDHMAINLNMIRMPSNTKFLLKANSNTMKTELRSPYLIDFSEDGTIASVLGFSKKKTSSRRGTPVRGGGKYFFRS